MSNETKNKWSVIINIAPHSEVLILLAVRLPLVYTLKFLLIQQCEALLRKVCLVRKPGYDKDVFLCSLFKNVFCAQRAVTDKVLKETLI